MRKRSRFLAILLSIAMILTFMPVISFATDDGDGGGDEEGYNISLNDFNPEWMEKDGDYSIDVETEGLAEAGEYELQFALSAAEFDGVDFEDYDEGLVEWNDLSPVALIPFSDFADYDEETSTVTLNGAALWAAVSDFTEPGIRLEVEAVAGDTVLANDSAIVFFDSGEEDDTDYPIDVTELDDCLFSDGTYRMEVDDSELSEEETGYTLEYMLETNDYDEDLDEAEQEWFVLEPFDDYAAVSGSTVTLDGAKIWEAVSDYAVPYVRFTVMAVKDKEVIATSEPLEIEVCEAYSDYEWEYGTDDEPEEYLAGESLSVYKENYGTYYSGEYPDGESFEYEVKKVTLDGVELEADDDMWFIPVTTGEHDVEITHTTRDGGNDTYAFSFVGVGDKYDFYIVDPGESNYSVLPGQTVTVTAEAGHEYYSDGEPAFDGSGFTYNWSVVEVKYDEELDELEEVGPCEAFITDEKIETAENNMSSTYSFKVADDADLDGKWIMVRASIVGEGEEAEELGSESVIYYITKEYYSVEIPEEVDKDMAVGESVTVTPSAYKHSLQDGEEKVEEVKGVDFAVDYDEDVFEVTNDGDTVDPGFDYDDAYYSGAFTIKRIGAEEGSVDFYGYKDLFEDDYLYCGYATISFNDVEEPEEPGEEDLDTAKSDAKTELEGYKNPDDYRDAEKADLAKAIEDGKKAIEEAVSKEAVDSVLAAAKQAIDSIKTDEQLTKEEAAAAKALSDKKKAAKAELDGYNPADYREAEKAELAKAVADGKAAIDAAKNEAEVNAAVNAAKTAIGKIKTDAQYKAEEQKAAEEAAKALAGKKDEAKTELDGYKKADDYRDAQKAELEKAIADGKAAIEAAKDEAGVKAAVNSAKAAIDKIKTDAQLKDEEQKAAQAAADKAAADKAAAEAKAKKVKTVTVNVKTVNAAALNKAIAAAGGSKQYVTAVVLGKKVKKIKANTFKGTKVTKLTLKTKKLKKKSVKNSLKGSKVKTIKVKVSSKKKTNKKYVKKYKKFFTKKNAGKKAKVK